MCDTKVLCEDFSLLHGIRLAPDGSFPLVLLASALGVPEPRLLIDLFILHNQLFSQGNMGSDFIFTFIRTRRWKDIHSPRHGNIMYTISGNLLGGNDGILCWFSVKPAYTVPKIASNCEWTMPLIVIDEEMAKSCPLFVIDCTIEEANLYATTPHEIGRMMNFQNNHKKYTAGFAGMPWDGIRYSRPQQLSQEQTSKGSGYLMMKIPELLRYGYKLFIGHDHRIVMIGRPSTYVVQKVVVSSLAENMPIGAPTFRVGGTKMGFRTVWDLELCNATTFGYAFCNKAEKNKFRVKEVTSKKAADEF